METLAKGHSPAHVLNASVRLQAFRFSVFQNLHERTLSCEQWACPKSSLRDDEQAQCVVYNDEVASLQSKTFWKMKVLKIV